MNNKGFTLVELLVWLLLVGIIFGLGFGLIRGTRSTALTDIDKIGENEIYNTAKIYVLENNVNWNIEDSNVYSCVGINDMISNGYFELEEVKKYQNQFVKVIKNNDTKVIIDLQILKECN